MINVLHLADIINRYDFIDSILRYCRRDTFRLTTCTFTEKGNFNKSKKGDIRLFNLNCPGRIFYPRAIKELVGILRREKIDILHTHHFDPTVVGLIAARFVKVPVIFARHYSNELERIKNPFKRKIYFAIEKACNSSAKRIIIPSTYLQNQLVRERGIDNNKVKLIPYGFDFARFDNIDNNAVVRLRSEFSLHNCIVIGTFARLVEGKGHVYLFEALKKLSKKNIPFKTLIVGNGPYREALEKKAVELGLRKHIIFTGWRNDILELISMVDIVVQPSLQDVLCQVMVEALAIFKPLIVTDIGATPDIVRNKIDGIMIAQRDSEAMYKAILELIENPGLARKLGESGRKRVTDILDIRKIIGKVEECYFEVCGK